MRARIARASWLALAAALLLPVGCSAATKCEPWTVRSVLPGAPGEESGSELLFQDERISVHRALVQAALALHVHEGREETVYVIAGEGRMQVESTWLELSPGTLIHVPRGVAHAVEARTPLSALTIFSPPFDGQDRRFLAAKPRP
jgi:mannose-6-phosphate isomerase-like protein (cupin superfamily)